MLNRIKGFIKDNNLIYQEETVIVAVSGGPDSMALLHIMKKLAPRMNFKIIAAHLNHCIREEADEEENYVREQCLQWEIPFYSRTSDVKEIARKGKKSLEDAGRFERYRFFNELKEETEASRIATAHHHDDVAETVLLHLLRGSGIKGLRGIMPESGNIIRPLLVLRKEEILDYLHENNIRYCLDKSNEDTQYLRNRIRQQLIPYLEKEFNPRIVETLNHLALIARDENQAIEDEIEQLWERILIKKQQDNIVLDNRQLLELQPAYQRRVIIKAFSALAGEQGWDMNDVQKVMDLSTKEGSSLVLHLKKKVRVNKSYDKMIFTSSLKKIQNYCYQISVPGQLKIEETGETYSFQLLNKEDYIPRKADIYLDYDCLKKPLYLRSRKDGDIFRPQGMYGSKKIKDFFIDLKIPYFDRDGIPLLVSGDGEIYAVLGLRIAQIAAAKSESRRILVIKKQ